MPLAPRFYQVERLDALVARGLAVVELVEPAPIVPDPPLVFGDTDLAGRMLHQQPDGATWHAVPNGVQPNPAVRIVLHDATVHGPDGVVTVGRSAVAETLEHVEPERAGALRDGALWVVREQFTGKRLPEAEHLLAGDCGTYYHWLLDGIARWALTPAGAVPCLLPWTGGGFQVSGPAAISALAARSVLVAPHEAVAVDRLHWTGSLTAAGSAFHPALRRFGGVRPGAEAVGADLFIARGDAGRRPMRSEAEAALLCEQRGFHVARLDGMLFQDQVALFAAARRIVAPHGGGLANLLFCHPGAAVLELHSDAYVNWCFRRLASTMGLRYGCLVGSAEPGEGSPHDRGWTIDLDRLAQTLDDPRFSEST